MAGSLLWRSCLNRGEDCGPRSAGVRLYVNHGPSAHIPTSKPQLRSEAKNSKRRKEMSVFGSIVSAIFGSKHAAPATGAAATASPPPSSSATAASPRPAGAAAAPGATAATPISKADVEAILVKLAAEQREDLDWRNSIVDLMKLLKLDSSLGARKQLAQELGYTGALDGSATMNVWLQKQVMTKLAESGGKVPDSLRA